MRAAVRPSRWLAVALVALPPLLLPRLAAARPGPARTVTGVVNLNTATEAELMRLPGIGPSKAGAIVAYRKVRPFRTPQEILRVKGIGRGTYARLKSHLAVQGPTTLAVGAAAPAVPAVVHGPVPPPARGTSSSAP